MTTDVVADMLTRIRNANQRFHKSVVIPSSKVKICIAEILKKEGYINDFKVNKDVKSELVLDLKYKGKTRAITGLKRISKPGLKVYTKSKEIPKVLNGLGVAIISTSHGIMTDELARRKNLGGEVVAYIW
ncbi:30S ribosomal protein S8 [Spiroplasma endosymbiont of Amphibalanus improvisus]|uniref:30S ribosomal protein S8 n=1 Tax=Spiroplasma endosymbiont of Amphibalanus improvisus TaxID=3066327 RepID=UPI00313DC44B